jgi:hypothetical protein
MPEGMHGPQQGVRPPNDGFVPGRLRAFPGPNIVDATEEQAILDIFDNHPNRDAALGELEALENEMLARLGGVYEDHTGPREDARELQRADYQRIRDVCGLDLTKELSFTQYKGHEQATAIVKIKAAYPWMTVLEAKAAIVKAVSGYKHEAVRARTDKKVVDNNDVVVLVLTASCLYPLTALTMAALASSTVIQGYAALIFTMAVACS